MTVASAWTIILKRTGAPVPYSRIEIDLDNGVLAVPVVQSTAKKEGNGA